jgi:hypothetical protein
MVRELTTKHLFSKPAARQSKDRSLRQLLQGLQIDAKTVGAAEGCDLLIFVTKPTALSQ